MTTAPATKPAPKGKVTYPWASAGHWTDANNAPMADPPAGSIKYGKTGIPNTGTGSDFGSGITVVAKVDAHSTAVKTWLLAYYGPDRLKSYAGKQAAANNYKDWNPFWLFGHTVKTQPKYASKAGSVLPDPGIADGTIPSVVGNPLSGIEDFLAKLSDPNFWLRVAEVLAGLLLLGVGLAKVTNLGPTIKQIPGYGKMIP